MNIRLEPQVWISHDRPEPDKITPVRAELFFKPRGGMWTSTLDERGGQWLRWVMQDALYGKDTGLEDERWGGKLWLLQPAEARIAVIANPRDLRELHDAYPFPTPASLRSLRSYELLVDWVALAEHYDAIHVPNPWPWRFGYDPNDPEGGDLFGASMFFYTLDAESTCWFRWCFEDVQELDPDPYLAKLRAGEED